MNQSEIVKNTLRPSHIPVIKAILDVLSNPSVIEFGMGEHSTPVWLEGCSVYTGIENSADWFKSAARGISGLDKCDVGMSLLDVGNDLEYNTYPKDIPPPVMLEILAMHENLSLPNADIVYIDGWASTRFASFVTAYDKADKFVVCHDTENPDYLYKEAYATRVHGFASVISYRPEHGKDGREQPYTDIVIKDLRNFDAAAFLKALECRHSEMYDCTYEMVVVANESV